jgi:hypothetical protein
MPPKRSRRDVSGQQHSAAGDRKQALCGSLNDAVNASVEETFQELEQERHKAEEERARLLAEAQEAAAKVKEVAEKEIEEIKRKLQEDRAALEEEKAAMEKVHTFQTSKILLNVGGHRFETSLQTLTSVPDTCFASMFSGRFEHTPDAEGAYFLDRDGRNFHYTLNFLRDSAGSFKLSSDVTEEQRDELAVELEFYGLLDRMMPYHVQERIRRALLQRACRAGTRHKLQLAVAQARALVFEIGSTTPFLTDEFQDLQFVITDRVVNGSPVWAAVGGELFMYRSTLGMMMVSNESDCVEGGTMGYVESNFLQNDVIVAPTDLPSDIWVSMPYATLELQYASAVHCNSPSEDWVYVPDMRITMVHGLEDGDPVMTTALYKLAALA